jgi:prepilin-type N-terminal cleavage/methylation domain-containing protein
MINLASNSVLRKKGFTLVELLVSVTIIALITAITVFNQNDYSDRLALTQAASDIELQIREMQQYGVSVREYSPNTNLFNYAYGVIFNTNSGVGSLGTTNSWSFVDVNQNGKYNATNGWSICSPGGGTSECISTTTLKYGVTIFDLCIINSSNGQNCKSQGGSGTPTRIDITFLRPNANAIMYFTNSSNVNISSPGYKGAKIQLRSPRGKTINIWVYTTGQVSVQ